MTRARLLSDYERGLIAGMSFAASLANAGAVSVTARPASADCEIDGPRSRGATAETLAAFAADINGAAREIEQGFILARSEVGK